MTRKPFCVVTSSGKAVRSNVLGAYATKEAESRRLTERFTKTDFGSTGLVAPLYDPEKLTKLLEMNTYHYRACKTKARDAAGLGWELVPDEEEEADATESAELQALRTFLEDLSRPLVMQLEQAQMDYEAVGWGCLEIVHEEHDPTRPLKDIVHIPSHSVRVHKDGNKYVQRRGNRKTWFRRPGLVVKGTDRPLYVDFKTGEELDDLESDKRASDLLFWTNYSPRTDYYGLPDVIPALGAITGDLARRDYNIAFFENFGVPAYAVFITGNFDPGEPETDAEDNPTGPTPLEAEIEKHFAELAGKPHSTLVLSVPTAEEGGSGEVKVEFVKLAADVKEASFRLYRQDNRDEVLASHAVPPYRAALAEVGSLGTNVAAETTEIYKRSVIEPRQQTLEVLINRFVVRSFAVQGWTWKLNEIDTTDEKHELDMLKGLWDMGAVVAREIRQHFAERFGLDPDAPLPEDFGPEGTEIEEAVRSLSRTILDRAEKAGLIETAEREMFEREFAGAPA